MLNNLIRKGQYMTYTGSEISSELMSLFIKYCSCQSLHSMSELDTDSFLVSLNIYSGMLVLKIK